MGGENDSCTIPLVDSGIMHQETLRICQKMANSKKLVDVNVDVNNAGLKLKKKMGKCILRIC